MDAGRGVAPVISVILMVAVTVILAAVISVFALGLGEQVTNTAPQAGFQTEYDNGTLTITHHSGSKLNADNLRIDIPAGASITSPFPSTVSSSDSVTISGLSPGDKVRIIWEDDRGETSAILMRFTVDDDGGSGSSGPATPTPTPTDNPPSASVDSVTDNSCEFYNNNSKKCQNSGGPATNERVEFSVSWSASDDNGLAGVTVELKDNNGNVVDSESPTVGGTSATGTEVLTDTGGYGDDYTIIVTATDSASQSDTVSATHEADGDATGSPP